MIDLSQRSEPYELELPYGLRVTVRPLTTTGMAAAQAAARRAVEAIERQAHERTDAGLPLDGLPDLATEGERDGFYQAKLIRELAIRHVTSWTSVELEEATVARACLQLDVSYAVQAKREIGKLWDDIEKAPYKVLFNPTVSGPGLWRAVQIMRQIDVSLQAVRAEAEGRERLLAVHGNRFIAHLVITRLPKEIVGDHRPLSDLDGEQIRGSARRTLEVVFNKINELYPDAYLGSLFKNAAKCQGLKDDVELDD